MRVFPSARAVALCAFAVSSAFASTQLAAQSPLHYPMARKGDQTDNYFGTTVADPYRWLENTESPETKQWIEAENALTFQYLASIPERASIKDQLTRVWNYPKYNVPVKRGKDYFFTENSGLQNQAVLYVQHGLKGVRKMVLDPNTLSTDGTVALGVWDATENGRYLAYAVAAAGSDWEEIRVRDVEKGTDLSDTLKWVKFSNIAWTKDHKGFFYSRFEEPKSENALLAKNTGQKLYYHYVGEPQAKDRLIYERPDHPQWGITATVSDDGEYVIIYVTDGTNPNNRIFFIDVSNPGKPKIGNPLVTLIDDEESQNRVIDNAGDVFFLQTTRDAPLGRVVAVDINKPAKRYWRPLIPEGGDKMEDVELIGGHFVVHTLKDAHSVLEIYALRGNRVGGVNLPGIGTINHVAAEWFFNAAGIKMQAVPYRGSAQLVNGVAAGDVPLGIIAPSTAKALIEANKLKVIGLSGKRRPSFLPASWPTFAESGFDVDALLWIGVFAPVGTPEPIMKRIGQEVARATADPEVKKLLNTAGIEVETMAQPEFGQYIRMDTARYDDIIRKTGIQIKR